MKAGVRQTNREIVMSLYRVAVVGAAGHVGLPLALVLAEHGNDTVGIDRLGRR